MSSLSPRNRLERWIARTVLSLPAGLRRWLAGAPVSRLGRTLDTQIQLMLKLQAASGAKPWYAQPVGKARRQLDLESGFLAPEPPALASVEALMLEGPDGVIPARIYRPQGLPAAAPALVFYHGGGFVLGSLESHDVPCRQLAAAVPCVVISVDYRLAPEYPFPAGPNDALAAFRDIARRAGTLGLDPARLAVGGDSAGGNLATVVAQQTRSDAIRPCFQLLIYPTVDATTSFPSIQTFAEGFLLQKTSIDWFVANYLPATQDKKDPWCSPYYGDLAGLPPAFVQTAGFDPLCDEGEAYIERMREAGVAVEARRYEGLIHGYLNMSGYVHAAGRAVDDLSAALRRAYAI